MIFGLTIPDLKAVTFLGQVFAKDILFQERMKKTLIIGHSLVPKGYIDKFEEDILEHFKNLIYFWYVQGGELVVYYWF